LTGAHNRFRKNIIEGEIDGSVRNEKRISIRLTEIEIIRMMSDDLGVRAGKSSKGSGS
jgi:hypothetical protein